MRRHPFESQRVTRRAFVAGTTALLLESSLGPALARASWDAAPRFTADPFRLGVASGDPLPDGVVLWTRLAPSPLEGGGMSGSRVRVAWELAEDDRMRRVIARGDAWAQPQLGHSVHVDVRGLRPATWYWYRFRSGDAESPLGRTRTAPARGSMDRLSFAFASCQHWETGYFTAYRRMLEENLDLVIHLGDYIYEDEGRPNRLRRHHGREIRTLEDYRNRYALYKGDADLQRVHAAFPWIVTWDDHEVDNNYAGEISEHRAPKKEFLARRAAAYQAFYEHMPLRRSSMPRGPKMELYRRFAFGDLAQFSVLDTRQYRTDQPCGDGVKARCAEAVDPRATLTGPRQERWLLGNLDRSRAVWNVIAQQVMMAEVDHASGDERRFSMDQWSGYVAARNRILGYLLHRRPSNPVVLTGDIHSNWAAELKSDFEDPASSTVGVEFVGTSISSGGNGADTRPDTPQRLAENPHVRFFNAQRGYVRCLLTPERWQTDYRIVPSVTSADSPVVTRASFVVERDVPGMT